MSCATAPGCSVFSSFRQTWPIDWPFAVSTSAIRSFEIICSAVGRFRPIAFLPLRIQILTKSKFCCGLVLGGQVSGRMSVPLKLSPVMGFFEKNPVFRIGDAPDLMADDAKLTRCRNLVRIGVMRISKKPMKLQAPLLTVKPCRCGVLEICQKQYRNEVSDTFIHRGV
jgi:hypothetical protein